MTTTPVGMRCPDCASQRTRVVSGPPAGIDALSRTEPRATYALIAINVLCFFAELISGAGTASIGGGGPLVRDGAVFGPGVDAGEYWRIITGGFLHAGLFHLAVNMFVLWVLGRLLEPAIGTPRFLAVYFGSLVAGSFGALLLTPDAPTVGASGAVYGLMGATILVARERGVTRLAQEVGIWLVLNIVITFAIPGISIGGHLGGLAAGFLAGLLISEADRGRIPRAVQALGLGLIFVGSVAGAIWAASSASPVF